MDLKDVILSTLAELETGSDEKRAESPLAPATPPMAQPTTPTAQPAPPPATQERLAPEPPRENFHVPDSAPAPMARPEHPAPAPQAAPTPPAHHAPTHPAPPPPRPESAYTSASFHIEEPTHPSATEKRESDEVRFLTSLRERVLVLFEGMQSPNNQNVEAKVDLILNFLEYQLAVIDDRIEQLSKP